jgi:opacity protein-like surface antigen
MKKTLLVLAIVLITPSSHAQDEDRKGLGISALLGGSICMESGDAECTGIDTSFGFTVGPVYRLHKHVGIGLDFLYGMYGTDVEGTDAYNMGLMVGPKGFFPIGALDLYAGIGLGWMRAAVTSDLGDASADGFGLGILAGFEYRVVNNLALGLMFRMNFNFADEVCIEFGGDERCTKTDVANNVMVGAGVSVYF